MSSKREPVERIVNFYSQKTLELLENEMTNDEPFEVILYHPSQSALARIEDDTEYDREETIGLWATMFAGITFMCDNLVNGILTPERAEYLIENLTHRCVQLLRYSTLNDADLRELSKTSQWKFVVEKMSNSKIQEYFSSSEKGLELLGHVIECFKKLQAKRDSLAQMDSLSSRFGSSMAISGNDNDIGHQSASTVGFGSNAPQAFEPPRPSMPIEQALEILQLPPELLGSDWLTLTKTVRAQVLELVNLNKGSGKGRYFKQAGQALINYSKDRAGYGGKRRTMKVKKHFRKTKKRFVKKGKKTRVRRNK
jgi:hypothetical protein